VENDKEIEAAERANREKSPEITKSPIAGNAFRGIELNIWC
jgi:hypothetical protein